MRFIWWKRYVRFLLFFFHNLTCTSLVVWVFSFPYPNCSSHLHPLILLRFLNWHHSHVLLGFTQVVPKIFQHEQKMRLVVMPLERSESLTLCYVWLFNPLWTHSYAYYVFWIRYSTSFNIWWKFSSLFPYWTS